MGTVYSVKTDADTTPIITATAAQLTELTDSSETTLHSHAGGGGANVKSGTVSVTENSSQAVAFGTAFAGTPRVTLTVESTNPDHSATLQSVSTTGFTAYLNKPSGGGATSKVVNWIATDAGNA
jgi:hypothetical protein